MTRGKQICRKLKDIRRRIAEANGIEYVAAECRYEGDCSALVRDARPRRQLFGISSTCAVPQAGQWCSQDFQPDCLRRRHRAAAEQGKAAVHATQVVSLRQCQAVIRLRKMLTQSRLCTTAARQIRACLPIKTTGNCLAR